MRLSHLPKPSPAFVVACAAVIIALSGRADSLPGSGSVDHDDLGAHVVHKANLHDNAVNGAKVASDSLTGADIKESTLKNVNAAKISGLSIKRFSYHVAENGPVVPLVTVAGFTISASCTSGQVGLTLTSPASESVTPEINGVVTDLTTLLNDNLEATFHDSTISLLAGTDGNDVVGHAEVMNANFGSGAPSLTINYATDEFTTFDECTATGSVIGG